MLLKSSFEQIELYFHDEDMEKAKGIKNFLSWDDICAMAEAGGRLTVMIAIKDDAAVRSVKDKLDALPEINVLRFVPETAREMVSRGRRDGYWDGTQYRFQLPDEEAIALLEENIRSGKPFLCSRWGGAMSQHVMARSAGLQLADLYNVQLTNNDGIYPLTEETLSRYTLEMISAAKEIDILVSWLWLSSEEYLFRHYSPNAALVSSVLQSPFYEGCAWTRTLAGKRVLVVHPFAETITSQYQKRDRLFKCGDVLPEFDLITYKAVQSIGGNAEYPSWNHALRKMKDDISHLEFDIALIGCGAYGMPLGAYIKRDLKRAAVHMGGCLQLLFGIKGKRWETEHDFDKRLYNEYWVRPSDNEKPPCADQVEGGCYW